MGASTPSDRADRRRITPAGRVKPNVNAILDRLDASDDGRFRNRRKSPRDRFRRAKVPVRITHPGGSTCERVVTTRNLSDAGIGFLYDSFLYTGTRVTISLPRKIGGKDTITGRVVYCGHVTGLYHHIGVKFDTKIFAQLYAEDPTLDHATELANVAASKIAQQVVDVRDLISDVDATTRRE